MDRATLQGLAHYGPRRYQADCVLGQLVGEVRHLGESLSELLHELLQMLLLLLLLRF